MVPYETERELTEKDGDYVKHIRVRRTDSDQYPCGYDYALHYGTIDGETLLRYDNAHERHKGHERHTSDSDYCDSLPPCCNEIRGTRRDTPISVTWSRK